MKAITIRFLSLLKLEFKIYFLQADKSAGCGEMPEWIKKSRFVKCFDNEKDNMCVMRCIVAARRHLVDEIKIGDCGKYNKKKNKRAV